MKKRRFDQIINFLISIALVCLFLVIAINIWDFGEIEYSFTSKVEDATISVTNLFNRFGPNKNNKEAEELDKYIEDWKTSKDEALQKNKDLKLIMAEATIENILNPIWRVELEIEFNDLVLIVTDMANLPCPAKAKEICELSQQASVSIIVAQNNLKTGLSNIEPQFLVKMNSNFIEFDKAMNNAALEIEKLQLEGK